MLGRAEWQWTRFASGRFKDLPRHAFPEVSATALSPPQNTSTTFLEVVTSDREPFEGRSRQVLRIFQLYTKVESILAGSSVPPPRSSSLAAVDDTLSGRGLVAGDDLSFAG